VKVPANIRVIDKRAAAAGVKVEGGAVVHVNAYDMATGKPVAGAKLRITERKEEGKDVSTGIANEDGFAAATKIPAGVYRIALEAEGYAPRVIGYEELSATHFRTYDIELSKAATVAGKVVDESGKPVAGANVRAAVLGIDGRGYNLPDIAQVTTNAEGQFELTDLPTGYVRLQTYSKSHHQTDIFKLHPAPSSNIMIQVAMTGSITGKVLGKDGKPSGKTRNIFIVPEGGRQKGKWSASGTLAADGSFEFHQVPPGKYYAAPTPIEGDPETKKDTKSFLVKPGEAREVMIEVE
jgi:5-hydroxyisourate hydrolase-like protein (transthyretin family)